MSFSPGRTYDNVYLVVVDAAGYSSIVRHNPLDRAAHAFDLLRERVVARVHDTAADLGCARSDLWSWRGDGGMLAVHDGSESVARDAALTSARQVLRIDLPEVRDALRHTEFLGELHLRIAVHKGTVTYAPDDRPGAIHSPVINLAAHLEELTPPDCLAISEAVHRVAGTHGADFELVGDHEGSNVYLMTPNGVAQDAHRAWLARVGLAGDEAVFARTHRPSQLEKVRLVRAARREVIDSGTALRTLSGYLTTAERPAHYRDAVLEFLGRGGVFRCVLLDPTCAATATLSEYVGENLADKIRGSMGAFARFKQRHGQITENLHVYQTGVFPGFAAIAVDLDSPDPMILYSPYLMAMKANDIQIEHGDSPHYLATTSSGRLLAQLTGLLRSTLERTTLERVL